MEDQLSRLLSCGAMCMFITFQSLCNSSVRQEGVVSVQTVSEMLTYHLLPSALLYSNGCSYRRASL